jgi:RND family efflux transporter MFP subunit
MPPERDTSIARPVRTLFNVGAIGSLTDGQLLERFSTDRGEVAELAFAALVERHGPMVRRVCRGILHDDHDVHDAFQASFLILVQKARHLWIRDSLGPWLHQVAYRTASCARSSRARRSRLEKVVAHASPERPREKDDDLEQALHHEIARLPDPQRATIVLCDLEGCTHEQAARHLGLPVGTIKSRLARARARLRERLTRRGFGPEAIFAAPHVPAAPQPLASDLVESTTRAAVDWLTLPTPLAGTASELARNVLGGMAMFAWLKSLTAMAAVMAVVSGVGLAARQDRKGDSESAAPAPATAPVAAGQERGGASAAPTHTVARGNLRITVNERGNLEAAASEDVYSQVEGWTTILHLVPEGTRVKKGDLIAELDAANLRDQLVNQEIAASRAQADYENALTTRRVAEIAVKEYELGAHPQEVAAIEAENLNAELSVQMAKDRVERTRRARNQIETALSGKSASATEILAQLDVADRLDAAKSSLVQGELAVSMAQTKLKALKEYTFHRMITELQTNVEKARSDELAKQAASNLEKTKLQNLERQIQSTKIESPSDGIVLYANTTRIQGMGTPTIEEGAQVRERQKLFKIADLKGPMRVDAKVRELRVDRVQPGQKVAIRVDAFPNESFTGTVETVAPFPDLGVNVSPKFYTTSVRFEKPTPMLRPGMTAAVEILIDELEGVLTVPVQAVMSLGGNYLVAVEKHDGKFEWRQVTLGAANDNFVEVMEGLKADERIRCDAIGSLSPEELKRLPARPRLPASGSAEPREKTSGRSRGR